jgi:two-component system response regulator PilR (NtrC family)
MQVKLLRSIQEKKVRPIGSECEIDTDIRILSATHKNLQEEISQGAFRQDLFYRINVIELLVPSLRERSQDIPDLADLFLDKFSREANTHKPTINTDALKALCAYNFPGNVRELENTLERAFTLCDGQEITRKDLQLRNGNQNVNKSLLLAIKDFSLEQFGSIDDFLADIEKEILINTLDQTNWNRTAAAKKLGITFRQIRYKLQKLELELDDSLE